jgi:hypothetical protein
VQFPVIGAAAKVVASFFVTDHLVKTDTCSLRVDVHFSHRTGLVSCGGETVRQGRDVGQVLSFPESTTPWLRAVIPVISVRQAGIQDGQAL